MTDETKNHTEKEIQEAHKKISEHVKAAYTSINEAKKVADEFNVSFDFDLARGMGGTYNSEWDDHPDNDWIPSSQSC